MRIQNPLPVALLLIGSACGGGSGTPSPSIEISKASPSGDSQHVAPFSTAPQPLRVKVTKDGAPWAGQPVLWIPSRDAGVAGNSVTDADGIATSSVSSGDQAGTDTVNATLNIHGLASTPRFLLFVDPGPAEALRFVVSPSNVIHGGVLAPGVQVAVIDHGGNTVTTAVGDITLVITANPNHGALTGGGPISAVNGVATFPAMSIDSIGDGYTVTASAVAVTSITSAVFSVTATPPLASAISVTVGTGLRFRSVRNGTANPAVDTLAVGGTVTWNKAGGSHNVTSTGAPSFPSSYGSASSLIPMGTSYAATFNTAGTYHYDCGIHGTDMTGRVIVK